MVTTIHRAFFHLQPGQYREHCSRLKQLIGTFTRITKTRYAFVLTGFNEEIVRKLECICSNERFKVLPQVFDDANLEVALRIEPDKDLFKVTGFTINSPERGFNDEYFRNLVGRLDFGTMQKEDLSATPYRFRSRAEVSSFFKATEKLQPKWVRDAFAANRSIIETSHSDTLKGHAYTVNKLLMSVDWSEKTLDLPSLESARAYLDAHLYGMTSVKDEILSILAALRRGAIPQPILLEGPPGTGKTAICNLLGKLFGLHVIYLELSALGRERDGICGSERHFENSTYGAVAQGFERARSSTSIMVLNELDKVFTDSSSQRSSANIGDTLLSILDRSGLEETYLEVRLPTDRLITVATCNESANISEPLLNRFHVIKLPPYTFDEKRHILNEHTLPKTLAANRLPIDTLLLDKSGEEALIHYYCTDAGVRKLEQYATKLVREHVRAVEEGRAEENSHKPVYDLEALKATLGPPMMVKNHFAVRPGEANCVCIVDGSPHLFLIEAAVRVGSGKCDVLGIEDDMQKQFCLAAYYAVRDSVTIDFTKLDVTFMTPITLPRCHRNFVGMAAFAALYSKLNDTPFEMQETCFVGGVDLHGNVYSCLDPIELKSAMLELTGKNIHSVYAPLGTAEMLEGTAFDNLQIIEAVDAKSIFDIASSFSTAS